ncbi:MAG: asparagine synthase (glutamine-hydrolyzing) [Candidatus Electrothrix sp. GW3-4]|uniref:asparagine synthase (glutamine-hydrolyzing) n=1 Tax=Candidatus Electrothrix sp. GW3-4 TaxID=3126740 RepID=UPI0030CEE289
MCGITGFLTHHSNDDHILSVQQMTDALQHRGPDDSGIWLDHECGVYLGHRRLAILDLSLAGHQPMHSNSGRYVIVFNGEFYNHLTLRKQLEAGGVQQKAWQGHSDTETLLACFETWGITKSLQSFVGMFALAVWDRHERQLILARDRMGEKPLYYGWCDGSFFFASELKALRHYSGFANTIARDVLSLYLRYSYIPTPYSIYKDIYKLEPGCMLTLDFSDVYTAPSFTPHAPDQDKNWALQQYWSLQEQVNKREQGVLYDEQEALSLLEDSLLQSVQEQSLADVPLGAFLSGGIDSSLIVALMQSQATKPVKTFTIGFTEDGYSEAVYAKAVAEHLQTDHTELYLNATQAMDVIPRLPTLYDEPFADSSQIPTFLVAQMARQYVTVALSGDGGDELFGGYNRYLWAPKIWRKIAWLPYSVRQQLSHLFIWLSQNDVLAHQQGIAQRLPIALAGEKLQKLGQRVLGVRDIDDFYLSLISEWRTAEEVVLAAQEPATLLTERNRWPQLERAEERMMYLDAMTYLPDDILCKVDRAAMGVSLETRVPFLDYRVVELAWQLPVDMKIRNGQGKWALRQLLYKYVPQKLIERPKQGFAIPLGNWLRGPLRAWAEHLLDPVRLAKEGYFRPEPIRKKWQEHMSGKRNWEHSLWSILMFQAWLETQQENS